MSTTMFFNKKGQYLQLRGVLRGKLRNIDAVAISLFCYVNIFAMTSPEVFSLGVTVL